MRLIKPFVIIALLALFSGVCLQLMSPVVAHASTSYTWTGKGDGVHWSDGNNWSPIGVPGIQSGDDATIAPGQFQAFPNVTLATSVSLQSLTLEECSDLQGGSLTVSSFNWTGVSCPATSFLGTSVTVTGTATINGAANSKEIQTPDGTTIPTLTLQGNTTLSDTNLETSMGKIVNTGTFTAQPGSTTITAQACCATLDQFVNQGAVIIPPSATVGPKVTISGVAFNDSGSVRIGSKSTLELQIAPSTFASGVGFTGAGTLLIDNNAKMHLSGNVTLGSGTTFLLGLDSNNSAGTLSGTGTLSGSGGIFSWTGGTLAANLTIASSVTASISGSQQKLIESPDGTTISTLTLQGNTTLSGTGLNLTDGNAKIVNTGTFTPQAGSTISALVCCAFPAQFINNGTLTVNVGAGNTFSIPQAGLAGLAFTNSGTVNLNSGTFQFGDPGYTQTAGSSVLNGGGLVSTSSAIVTLNGGSLTGNGTITANVQNAAVIDPGSSATNEGIITLAGNYTQTSSGMLQVDIKGSTTPGTDYDQLAVNGTASLNGTLDFNLVSYTPTGTDFFTVITYKKGTGQFAKLQPQSTQPRYWVHYKPTAAVLSYGPWGVDSDSTTRITSSSYSSVQQKYGTPDFWGRYIGDQYTSFNKTGSSCTLTNTPYGKDIASNEANEAHNLGLAILPVYFNFSPQAVTSQACGVAYAKAAIAFAQHWAGPAIPQGTVIFVDIEYQYQPDAAFIKAWYDTFNSNFSYTYNGKSYSYATGYYKAGYYGDTGSQGLFNTPYCTAVSEEKQIGTNSYIWSSHALLAWPPKPKATEPTYKPPVPPCANQTFAWQYGQAPTNPPPTPNVDTDEALPGLPFWYP